MFKKFLALTLLSFSAKADIFLQTGDQIQVGSQRIYCGAQQQVEKTFRCSMKICTDPWGNPSSDHHFCVHNHQYKMEFRSVIGSRKEALFDELSNLGINDPNTFTCEEI